MISFSFLYWFLKTKYWNQIGKNIPHRRLDNGNVNWCILGGHFCVGPGLFVSNRAFLCRTMHFAVEPGFFVSKQCYNMWFDIWHDMTWHDMTWHEMILIMIWYDMIWYDMIWYITRHDTTYLTSCHNYYVNALICGSGNWARHNMVPILLTTV